MSTLARAAILAVGSELLTPSKIDTNSLFITEQLNLIGIEPVFKAVVGDDRAELATLLRLALDRADLVICSGGLGPTDDDVTRDVVADLLGRSLREDEDITGRIRERFSGRGLQMPEINRRQAMVPDGARVLANAYGSAPGLWLEHDGRVLLLLPGPPRELKPMLTALVGEDLRRRVRGGMVLVRRIIRITGRSESHVEEAVRPLYPAWASASLPISATILASLGQIELHLSVRAADRDAAEQSLDAAVREVLAATGDYVYSTDGRSLEQVVGDLLAAGGLRIGVAESCTGGLTTSRLTDVPGSSRYVDRAAVTYSNEAKTTMLGVSSELIAIHGAVSEPVALAMAAGIRDRAGVHVGLGVTGIAGPGGGSPEKPVGTVAIAAVAAWATRVGTFRFLGGRDMVKFQASQAALDMLRRMLQSA